jgi:uncharacterized membrane protein
MDKRLLNFSMLLAVLGLLVSIYMTIYKYTENSAMCIGNGGCSTVNASPYSEVNGIPVALIGVIGYGAILGTLWLEKRTSLSRNNTTLFVFGMGLTGFIFTVYLIYIEFAKIKALCPFCLTSQVTMTILFILSIIRLLTQPQ